MTPPRSKRSRGLLTPGIPYEISPREASPENSKVHHSRRPLARHQITVAETLPFHAPAHADHLRMCVGLPLVVPSLESRHVAPQVLSLSWSSLLHMVNIIGVLLIRGATDTITRTSRSGLWYVPFRERGELAPAAVLSICACRNFLGGMPES